MTAEQDTILKKLTKIKAMADGAQAIGNEAEAQAFATRLNELLLKHKLQMTDVEYAAHVKEEPIIERTMRTTTIRDEKGHYRRVYEEYPDVEVKRRRVEWIETLGKVIARAHSCEIIVQTGSSKLYFVGMKSSVDIVEYLFITMVRAADKLASEAYGVRWHELLREGKPVQLCRGFKASWLEGFITRLIQRFDEARKKMEGDTTFALVRIDKEAKKVKEFLDSKLKSGENKLVKAVAGQAANNAEGLRRGRAAADKMRLDANAVTEGRPNQQLRGE